jgi:hypothetical protein
MSQRHLESVDRAYEDNAYCVPAFNEAGRSRSILLWVVLFTKAEAITFGASMNDETARTLVSLRERLDRLGVRL